MAPTTATDAPEPPAPEPPARLYLPTQDVSADVLPVSVSGRELGVPEDPADVGWWTASARPGAATGSTVIDGHVDSAELGAGALFRLGELDEGAPVYVESGNGRRTAYRVVARQVYPKEAGLPADVFRLDGPHRLVLITCGGAFDEAARGYDDNIVVVAEPAR